MSTAPFRAYRGWLAPVITPPVFANDVRELRYHYGGDGWTSSGADLAAPGASGSGPSGPPEPGADSGRGHRDSRSRRPRRGLDATRRGRTRNGRRLAVPVRRQPRGSAGPDDRRGRGRIRPAGPDRELAGRPGASSRAGTADHAAAPMAAGSAADPVAAGSRWSRRAGVRTRRRSPGIPPTPPRRSRRSP